MIRTSPAYRLACPSAGFVAKPAGWTGVVHVTTTAPEREYALAIGDPSALTPWDGATAADATLTLPAEALARLVYGRLDADHTPAGVTATGADLDTLRATYPGFKGVSRPRRRRLRPGGAGSS